MKHREIVRAGVIVLAAAASVGCGETTAPQPGDQLDTEAALGDYEAMESALSSPELRGFRALGERTPFGGPAGIGAAAGLSATTTAGSRAFALELLRSVAASRAASRPTASPIISETHRGVTFVYDGETDRYVVDPEREGAPATGVRFVTYEVDDTGTPIPDEERGWADLIDEGDVGDADVALRLIVVDREETVLDYATTLDASLDRGLLTVRGYIVGDGVRLDFDIEAVGHELQGEPRLDAAFELRVDARDFRIVGEVSGIEGDDDGDGEIHLTVGHGPSSLRIDVTAEAGMLDGLVYLNGDVFAAIAGTADDPVFTSADGDALRWGELLVLRHVFDAVEDVFDFLEDLVDPVDELVVLGIIL